MRRFAVLAFLAFPGLLACQGGVPVEEAVASITEQDFYNKVEIIAHDSMLGRANPSPGLDMTAQWVADEFKAYGLEPGGDNGTFIQHYRIREMGVDFDASSAQVVGGPALEFGADLNYMQVSGGGEVTAPVAVLAGNLAAAQDLPPDQVAGKHLVVVPAPTPQTARRRRARLPSGVSEAGPASVLFMDQSSDEDWEAAVTRRRESSQRLTPGSQVSEMPMLNIRQGSLESLLASQGMQLSQLMAGGEAVALMEIPDLEITLTTAVEEVGGFDMPNSVGVLEGSDPELKDEYIVYSAHMDHVGVGRPNEEGDSIRNGADDDASGTVAVVELAKAFGMLADPPRRSIIFLGVSGEESGLWGSRFFAENPPVPIEQIVANLNADMISRNWPDTVVAIGKEHSDLGETMNRVNAEHPELHMFAIDDIWPEQNFYNRSDHVNFARRGVPILFFFTGTHDDYHQVTDEVEKINAEKASRITKLLFYMGLEVGNADERPQWNPESYEEIVTIGR
jgi:hypothetical protein